MGAPPMGPPPGGPPDAKRQRTGGLVLEPEEEFLAKYPGPSKVLCHTCHVITACSVLAVCMCTSTTLFQPVFVHVSGNFVICIIGPSILSSMITDSLHNWDMWFICSSYLIVQVLLLCPSSDESEMLNGQLLEVEVASLQDTVGELKSRLADVVGIAANKQKIGRDQLGFLKDELTLAHYNVSPDIQLTLGVKERGGRKK